MEVELDGIFRQNGTYDYDNDYEYVEDIELKASGTVLIPVLYSVELVLGLLGNGLLLAVLAQKRRSWSISDTFILHLGVADILLLLTLPLWAAQAARQHGWCFGGFLCKISGALFHINFYFGIFLLVCISLDRYRSVAHGTQLFSPDKPRYAHMTCLLAWLASLFLVIPHAVFLEAKKAIQDKMLCVHSFSQSGIDWLLVSRLLHFLLGFLLPAIVLIVCCCCILLLLQRSSKSAQKHRAAVVTLILVLVFLLCWIPYNITLMVDTFKSSSKEREGIPKGSLTDALMVTSGLGCMHACLRPLLYLSLCRNFRKRSLATLKLATVRSESSLWEVGVGEKALPDKNQEGEELNQMTSVNQAPSTQC